MTEPLIPTPTAPDDLLEPGVYIGPYLVERVLGAGMFGTVYAARHPVIENQVAIKVLHRRYSSDPEMVARFVDEARAASHIDHPGIVTVFDFGRLEDGRRYTVMEHLVGRGLDALLADRGPLSTDEALAILEPLAHALEAAHAAGVAHRDVKPGNIFVCDQGPPKLLDFGVAKLLGMPSDAERTATGVAVGTPAYMAPEQCLGTGVGPAVDVYALGVLAFRMLTGRLPFEAEGSVRMMAAHLNDPPPWLHRVDGRFGRGPGFVLRQMMAKAADERPAPVEGITALRAAFATPRSRWVGLVLVATIVVGLVVGWLMLRPTPVEPPRPVRHAEVVAPTAEPTRAPAPTEVAPLVTPADATPPDATTVDAGPPATVRLVLDGLPAGAAVERDGVVLPLVDGAVELPQGRASVTLRLTAPGHRATAVQVIADGDKTVTVSLPQARRPRTRPSGENDIHGVDDW